MPGALEERLEQMLQPSIDALGYELVGIELVGGAGGVLRVYIDNSSGVSVDDCASVSRQVSTVLDVEDPIPGAYTLEVSSPGVDRPLFKARDYERFAGSQVKVQLSTPRPEDGRRRFAGVLRGLEGELVLVEDEEERHELPLASIAKAKLVGEL